jgi:hypothetical protein
MSKTVTITLNIASESTGNFSLYDCTGDCNNRTCTLIPFETNISRADLMSGYITNNVPDSAELIVVESNTDCTNSICLVIPTSNDCQCPEGYTIAADGFSCYTVATTSPTSVDSLTPSAGSDNGAYGSFGVKIYNIDDYNISGYTISGGLLFSGFTTLFDGSSTTSVESFWVTRMNANNLWVSGNSQWPGNGGPGYPNYVSFCSTFNTSVTSTYWVGIGGDNDVTIKLNGTTIVNQPDGSQDTNFKFWHIYPVELQAGPNIIELENWNRSSVGSFSAEIYLDTYSTLTSATNINQLNVVFSTGDYLPGGSKEGEGFCSNYSCPSGYSLDLSNPSSPICKQITYTTCNAS